MKFTPLPLPGVLQIEIEPVEDSRGFFGHIYCAEEFAAHGLPSAFAQHAISYNHLAGTLRGLHYQRTPQEAKLVRCIRGAVFDVVVDLRPSSDHYAKWCAVELDANRRNAVYVPKGCAHGFQTLTDAAELLYQIDVPFDASAAAGIRWDDPTLAIDWPLAQPILSQRDRDLPWLA
jgi:dTDP-4-dehydrorhamnose 3,5-epimerase